MEIAHRIEMTIQPQRPDSQGGAIARRVFPGDGGGHGSVGNRLVSIRTSWCSIPTPAAIPACTPAFRVR